MKFIFSDSLDVVDPGYDFIADRTSIGRERQHDEKYPHEMLERAPYDGILISRAVLFPGGKYTPAQTMRFLRDGGRAFLRFNGPHQDKILMGDNGAFAYATLDAPPYTVEETLDFYADGLFTHGCSLDHIIFDYLPDNPSAQDAPLKAVQRFELTIQNAEKFLKLSPELGSAFTPIGTVQGWSPESKADSAKQLEAMGYRYLAIGGLVPLRTNQIHDCLKAIRKAISPEIQLHLLGFARVEQIHHFLQYDIASFDSTSPLIRAFKDSKNNYYSEKLNGGQNSGLDYYTAIRIPQATENAQLKRAIKEGRLNQEILQTKEALALERLRAYDKGDVDLDSTIDAVVDYNRFLIVDDGKSKEKNDAALELSKSALERTLRDQPWKHCLCSVCRTASIEVIIFRGSNRNKRRGFHNLNVYYEYLQKTLGK